MDYINILDRKFFYFINQTLSNPVLDAILPWLRTTTIWLPLYLFILLFLLVNSDNFKQCMWWIICFVALVSITDIISSHIIKPMFYKLRPCRDLSLDFSVRLLAGYCGSNSSYISSHASNHFAMAFFASFTLQKFFAPRKLKIIAFSWACMISFAQIYVGVHYPLDIFRGMLLGIILGIIFVSIYYKFFEKHTY